MLTRRSLITGFTGILCAPAIIRVAGIMPVKAERLPIYICWQDYPSWPRLRAGEINIHYHNLYDAENAADLEWVVTSIPAELQRQWLAPKAKSPPPGSPGRA